MNDDLVIHARERDIGGFSVHRSLPSTSRRHVGPFVFLDHMGPVAIDETHKLSVRPHPHIGLATVTYLFEGRGLHRDSLGSNQIINPGDLNWMTSGKGIVHSEHTPEADTHSQGASHMHGVQIWIGLPVEFEECDPSFSHWPKEKLPLVNLSQNLTTRLMLGSFGSAESPVKTLSRTLFMDVDCSSRVSETLSFDEKEIGIFLVSGNGTVNGNVVASDDLVVLTQTQNINIEFSAGTRLVIIGGDPFAEARYLWWNFVSSRKERIRQAADDWQNQRFGRVQGEDDVIPLPKDFALL